MYQNKGGRDQPPRRVPRVVPGGARPARREADRAARVPRQPEAGQGRDAGARCGVAQGGQCYVYTIL